MENTPMEVWARTQGKGIAAQEKGGRAWVKKTIKDEERQTLTGAKKLTDVQISPKY